MFDILKTGGFLIWPILLASLLAVAIVLDRFWALRSEAVAPADLVDELKKLYEEGRLSQQVVDKVRQHSALGQILAAGLQNMNHSREVMKEAISHHFGVSCFCYVLYHCENADFIKKYHFTDSTSSYIFVRWLEHQLPRLIRCHFSS